MTRKAFLAIIVGAIASLFAPTKKEAFPARLKIGNNTWHRGDEIYEGAQGRFYVYSIPNKPTCAFLDEHGKFMIYRYASNDYETIHLPA